MKPNTSTDSAVPANGRLRSCFCLWLAALAVILGLLLHESLFGGKGLVPADAILSFPPWQDAAGPSNFLLSDQFQVFVPQHEFMYQQFWLGHVPLWNPCIDCGVPNLASSQGALLYPINLLLLPVSPFYASGWAAFLKLFLAGWFTMLYLRVLGASNRAAFLSGLVFSLSGFMISWLGHPHVNSAIFLPLFLYLIERMFQNARAGLHWRRLWVGFALAFGCMLLGGHPPTMIHVTLFIGGYFLFRWSKHCRELPWKIPGWWLSALLVGCLLAAPAILPYLEYDHHSSESFSSDGLQRSQMRLPLNALIFYLFPHLSGSPPEGFEETMLRLGIGRALPNFTERTGYVGILPLMFAVFAVVRRRCRLTKFYAAVVVVGLLFVCGMPPLPAILTALPVLHAINPMRLLLVIGFSVAVLAGLGWDEFQRGENRGLKFWVVTGFWTLIGLVLLSYWHTVKPWLPNLDSAHRNFLQPQFAMLAGSMLVSVSLLLKTISQRQALTAAVGLGWIACDLLVFGRGYNPAIPRDRYYPTTPAIAWLKNDPAHFRILGDKYVLLPNTAEIFGLQDVRGCDFTTVRRYEELITGQAGDFSFYKKSTSLPVALPLLSVKYVLSLHMSPPDPSQFELAYSNTIDIYRNRAFQERALAVFDCQVERDPAVILKQVRSGIFDPKRLLWLEENPQPAATSSQIPTSTTATKTAVQITAEQPDQVEIEASLSRPSFLLLLDTYFPGWTATVNGRPTKIYRADYNFRAIALPAGKSAVCFAYRPTSFRLGIAMSSASLLALGTVWFWSRMKKTSTSLIETRLEE